MLPRRLFGALTVVALAGACSSGKTADRSSPKPSPVSTAATAPSSSSSTAPVSPTSCPPTTKAQAGGGGKETSPPGDIPDTQAFVPYNPPDGLYTVNVPEGWARSDGARAVTFTDKFNSVRVALADAPQPPTVETAQADEVPKLAASAHCFGAGTVTTVTRTAGTAVLITYKADGPTDAVTGKVVRDDVERYEFWRNGTAAILTLSAPGGSDNVDPWRLITNSFAWR